MSKKDRLSSLGDSLLPGSLVGSYFHGDDLQGCVVAEVAPTIYLVETFEWLAGSSHSQRLVKLEQMMGWRFYDDSEWMKNAYEEKRKRDKT